MEIILALHLISLNFYIYRSVKLPAVTKALQKKQNSSTAASPLDEEPVTVDDDKDEMEVKLIIVKDTAKSTTCKKELFVDIEVMTLKSAVETEGKRQTARRGKKFR